MSLEPEALPAVPVIEYRGCDTFGVVADAATTQGQYQVNLVVAGNLNALAQFLQRGIAHHAGILDHGLAGLPQDGQYLVIDTVALNAATAVVEQHHGTIVL